MAREISQAEAWERAHEVFSRINFNAFDFNSIKESLLDYTKLYFPEDFNDYIESSEFIAILELFAYVGELLAYRIDLNAHENFITTAQRKESVLRLAKLISYKASRNIPARGLVKITSIQTTETVIDSTGRNLAGRRIYWNDNNNPDWEEQFLLVLNRVLEQEFGTVAPSERKQVDDVLFELYTFNNNPISQSGKSVLPFTATANGQTLPMEIVPINLIDSGPEERRPEINAKMSMVYANDGLGNGSDTTGFLMFAKQGQLQFTTTSFDGVTPNQTHEININNINETDVWINHIDPNTGEILINDPYVDILPHLVADDLRYGEWVEVDLANAQNILFNTNKNRHKYEIETLDNDQVRVIFGDGEFSDIPSGTFHLWYRASANQDIYIEKSSVVDQSSSITYTDTTGTVQTLSFTFSLVSSLLNASASEDIEHIRRVAPAVYYTQDRMVNGRDYNTFMLQDPTILKLRSVNRTFAGDSKYIAWHDPKEYYENVKIFGDDLAMYWVERDPGDGNSATTPTLVSAESMLDNYIEPLLSSSDFFGVIGTLRQEQGLNPATYRTEFSDAERLQIIEELQVTLDGYGPTELYYDYSTDVWEANPPSPSSSQLVMVITDAPTTANWTMEWRTRRLVVQSATTQFWNTNTTESVINFDTLNSNKDRVIVLKANTNGKNEGILSSNQTYIAYAQELIEQGLPNEGLVDTTKLIVLPDDANGDNVPDNLIQTSLFDAVYEGVWPGDFTSLSGDPAVVTGATDDVLDLSLLGAGWTINNALTPKGLDADIEIYTRSTTLSPWSQVTNGDLEWVVNDDQSGDIIVSKLKIYHTAIPSGNEVRIIIKNFVYFTRDTVLDSWYPVTASDAIRTSYMTDTNETQYTRIEGRYPLNFAWFHTTPRLNLVDPAASNIIDTYIITKGYYTSMVRWIQNRTDVEPDPPTPFELRTTYSTLIDNKMISDTLILHPGKFKLLFGSRAIAQLQCRFKVIRPTSSTLTDNQVKVRIVDTIRSFFDIETWEFGETFFFTELAASIHSVLGPEIDSIVLVPLYAQNQFGDMFQIQAAQDELFLPDVSTADIEIVQTFTKENIRQDPA